ncbi:hypothetical protein [Enterococcus sp. LJL51]|uniref:hypothetical protein n=1 Tax=Enterococcus sp. LJL51 TaxID=3416656 RepID=UPI003CF6863A
MKLSDKVKSLSKKQKAVIISGIALIIVACGAGYKVYADNQYQKETTLALELLGMKEKELKAIYNDSNNLFSKDKSDFLTKDVDEKTITTLEERLISIEKEYEGVSVPRGIQKDTALDYKGMSEELLSKAEKTLSAKKQVNMLFEKEAIIGDEVDKNLPIKNDLSTKNLENIEESFYVKETKSEFEKATNELIDTAKNQVKQIETAKVAVEKVYKDKVISTDQKLYDFAKKEVDKIKNQKSKKSLDEKLDKVKKEISAKKKSDEEKKESVDSNSTEVTAEDKNEEVANEQAAAQTNTEANFNEGQQNTPAQDYNSAGGGSAASNSNAGVPVQGGNSQTGGTPTTPAQPDPTPTPTPDPTPQPTVKYQGWVEDENGGYYTSPVYSSQEEAIAWVNAKRRELLQNNLLGSSGGISAVYG